MPVLLFFREKFRGTSCTLQERLAIDVDRHAELGELLVAFHAHPWEDFHDHHRSPKGVELEEVVHQCCWCSTPAYR